MSTEQHARHCIDKSSRHNSLVNIVTLPRQNGPKLIELKDRLTKLPLVSPFSLCTFTCCTKSCKHLQLIGAGLRFALYKPKMRFETQNVLHNRQFLRAARARQNQDLSAITEGTSCACARSLHVNPCCHSDCECSFPTHLNRRLVFLPADAARRAVAVVPKGHHCHVGVTWEKRQKQIKLDDSLCGQWRIWCGAVFIIQPPAIFCTSWSCFTNFLVPFPQRFFKQPGAPIPAPSLSAGL